MDNWFTVNKIDVNDYEFFQGMPTKVLTDHDIIDIGGGHIEVLHTPGHAPGHLCFWERDKGYGENGKELPAKPHT